MLRAFSALVLVAVLAGCQASGLVPNAPVTYAPADGGDVGIVGTLIGKGMDDSDRAAGLAAEYRALERGDPGKRVEWYGRFGAAGVVIPGPRYRINDRDCREFTHTVRVNDAVEVASATACRTPDGVWRTVG